MEAFLETEYSYEKPVNESNSENYRHVLVYRNKGSANIIEILNAYHPYDYGFEINLYLSNENRENRIKEMIYYKPKENQDRDLQLIKAGAEKLKNFLTG